jgi:hypothetical protein
MSDQTDKEAKNLSPLGTALSSSLQKIALKYKGFFEIVISIVGFGLTIYGIFGKESITTKFFAITLSVSYLIVIIFLLITQNTCRLARRKVKQIDISLKKTDREKKKNREFLETMMVFTKNLSKCINTSITSIKIEVMKYQFSRKQNDGEFISNSDELKSIYSSTLIRLLDNFISFVFRETNEIMEQYILLNGYKLNISMSLKLFNRILNDSKDSNAIDVYTAYRNENSPEDREIGKAKFTVSGNTVFNQCLDGKPFISNNIKEGDNNYRNENPNWYKNYNCTASVQIISNSDMKKI